MSIIIHHAIVCTSNDYRSARAAYDKAEELELDPTLHPGAKVNNCYTFMIPPDGSKEGWPESYVGDNRRAAWKDWARQQESDDSNIYLEWVEVEYGDDMERARVNSQPTIKPENEVMADPMYDIQTLPPIGTGAHGGSPNPGDILVEIDGHQRWVDPKVIGGLPPDPDQYKTPEPDAEVREQMRKDNERSDTVLNLARAYGEIRGAATTAQAYEVSQRIVGAIEAILVDLPKPEA